MPITNPRVPNEKILEDEQHKEGIWRGITFTAGYREHQLRQAVFDCREIMTDHEIEEAVRSALENG